MPMTFGARWPVRWRASGNASNDETVAFEPKSMPLGSGVNTGRPHEFAAVTCDLATCWLPEQPTTRQTLIKALRTDPPA